MINHNAGEQWSVYESNVQAYRGNFLSSQSLLLAVGAITLDKSIALTIFISIIALIQVWYIWVRTIYVRTRIVDYYKYNMNAIFDSSGNQRSSNTEQARGLDEDTYLRNAGVRKEVHRTMTKLWGRPEKFRTLRLTRLKFDILIPISITLIWFAFMVYSFVA
jgi:hypothetical protein